MKLPLSWLNDYVKVDDIDPKELAEKLTRAGLQVEGIETVGGTPLSDLIVVAEVLECEAHPNSDHLHVCKVTDGKETFQVVCGAPNMRKGIKTAFAKIGAAIPEFLDKNGNPEKIKKGKLRGVESFGMCCSEKGIPEALAATDLVCSSVNVASTKAGINMDAVAEMGRIVRKTAELTADRGSIGCAKLVVFANAPEDNPFMAGAFHGLGEPETVINVGVSGPGVVASAIRRAGDCSLAEIAEIIKKTAFKITRVGQLVAREASNRLGVPFGIVDLSLAPTPAIGDSVAHILESMGLEQCGAYGTTAALALLNDAVKKGGVMASSQVGGLSGAFIPVSEDAGMIAAARSGALHLEKLEAMTAVCSVGLDMIAIPGDTPAEVISGIIADEIAIGVVNTKTTAVRVIPAIGCKVGDTVNFGGLLGEAPVMPVNSLSPAKFIARGGRIPAPIHSLKN